MKTDRSCSQEPDPTTKARAVPIYATTVQGPQFSALEVVPLIYAAEFCLQRQCSWRTIVWPQRVWQHLQPYHERKQVSDVST